MPESRETTDFLPYNTYSISNVSDEKPNPLEGLLDQFALGPAWARGKSDDQPKKYKDGGEREYKPRRRDDRHDGGGGGRGRDNRNDGRGRRFDQGGRGRPEPREEIAPAEGVNVSLFPEKEAIRLICKEVHQVARVYSLFDIAQTMLSERKRMTAQFEISEKHEPFFSCKFEDAIYLTKEEALRHFLQADWRERFVEESTIEVEPPKGNFQSVARCGISGEWLGPPNYHAYQTTLRRIHRERFANMPFEAYSAKVRTERSEEAVAEWMESMKTQTRWRILTNEEIKAKKAELAAAKTQEKDGPTPVAETTEEAPPVEIPETPAEEPKADLPEAAEPETSAEAPESSAEVETPGENPIEEPAAEEKPTEEQPEQIWITDRAEAERAVANDVLGKAFNRTRKAKVSAAIAGKFLSPGLLVRLKGTGNHHRKHPAIIIPGVCRVLESEHMPVFKRKGKLYTGPARPSSLAPDAVLAPRPGEMVKWIRENTPAKLEGLWKALLPEGATAPPQEYAADLFWLLQQGHILLYTDDLLVVQEQPKPQEPKKKKAKPAPKSDPESTEAETPAEIVSDAIAVTAGLVAEVAEKITDAVSEAIKDEEAEVTVEVEQEKEVPESPESETPTAAVAPVEKTTEASPSPEVEHPEASSHNSPEKPEASTPLPPAEPESHHSR
ncbi:hypothetical protein [Luteolibacter sp. AS25]|uniref:hypothetical protein n=1 Tax=Luteolibacter sp. AS25 TaxID=3135776 RepID=UPI00398BA543